MEEQNEYVVDFILINKEIKSTILEEFKELEIIESNAFTGSEMITIIFSAGAILIDKILNFYIKNRQVIKATTIKVGKDEINLTGFSNKELEDIIKKGSLEKLKEIMNKK